MSHCLALLLQVLLSILLHLKVSVHLRVCVCARVYVLGNGHTYQIVSLEIRGGQSARVSRCGYQRLNSDHQDLVAQTFNY